MPSFQCNTCLRALELFSDRPSSDNPKSYLSECLQHIFCGQCAHKLRRNCGICKRHTRFQEIRKEMPIMYRMLFEPLQSLLKTYRDVRKFQTAQEDWNFKQVARKNADIKPYGRNLNQKLHEQNQINESISKQNEKLRYIIQKADEKHHRPAAR